MTVHQNNSKSLNYYHSASHQRFDTWHRLEEYIVRLHDKQVNNLSIKDDLAKVARALDVLEPIEFYWAFPSADDFRFLRKLFLREDYQTMASVVAKIVRALSSKTYRRQNIMLEDESDNSTSCDEKDVEDSFEQMRFDGHYFEVLIVDEISEKEERSLREGLLALRQREDKFIYDVVVVPTFEDALIAVMFNDNIQACVIRYGFPFTSRHDIEMLKRYLPEMNKLDLMDRPKSEQGSVLGNMINELRPEIDLYLVTNVAVEEIAATLTQKFLRIFYHHEDYMELHLSILLGIAKRFDTPFFNALRDYSRRPTGVFHALPISRGKSVSVSNWLQDMAEFYGPNLFLAETSATTGGLDSLSQPWGPIKKAQELAARAFGAHRTYFITNGTSTANKVVMQASIQPGDVVLIDHSCHKSHHYGMVLTGAHVEFMDGYTLDEFSIYGAVPIKTIKSTLLKYKRASKLDRVKMLLLTNCTFDGIIYNVEQVIEECLAIKPDLIFLWDEAWFAFARCHPLYRQRTAMDVARRLTRRYKSSEYRTRYHDHIGNLSELGPADDELLLNNRLLPDPDKVRLRVYATQSTHKTLTSLRQGSMIHIHDEEFGSKADKAFEEAYMTHISTSPNYQILASLDAGRRQVELEGFELVRKQMELAMALHERIMSSEQLSKYFRVLQVRDLVPAEYRKSGTDAYYNYATGWSTKNMEQAWMSDEFVVDPSRITLYIGCTGLDGSVFRNRYLMDKFGIQINKATRNTVLFMTNIGTTRSAVAYLIGVLVQIAKQLDEKWQHSGPVEKRAIKQKINLYTKRLPPLPHFSCFHECFRTQRSDFPSAGDIRKAYFHANDAGNCSYMQIDNNSIDTAIKKGRQLVSATFITPYPPGFPILVPGQVITADILDYMRTLDIKEIHGYFPEFGFPVFREKSLDKLRMNCEGK